MLVFCIAAAICGYLSGGINGAVILCGTVYKKDIRTLGSGNPGFTNCVRVFGLNPVTVSVMLIDILKTALPVKLFSALGEPYLGAGAAAFTGLFCMLGHAFPIWYGFKGGKAFVAWATAIWFIEPRAAAIVIAVFLVILFTVKYMSLASMSAAVLFPVVLVLIKSDTVSVILSALCAALMLWRHHANIARLINGTEPKFSFGLGKKKNKLN